MTHGLPAGQGKVQKSGERRRLGGRPVKIIQGGRDMVEKNLKPFPETQKPVCS